MILIVVPLLLPFVSADILRDHLTHNVNYSINPCDDFFLHVCSQSVNETDFPYKKIDKFYQNLVEKFANITNTRNLSIMNDFMKLNGTGDHKPSFNRSAYETLIRTRCQDSDVCYRQEFEYFSNFYKKTTFKMSDRLMYFLSKLNKTKSEDIFEILPNLVEATYNSFNLRNAQSAKASASFYISLITRLFIMEELHEIGVFDKIDYICDDVKAFKALIVEKFRNTPWLNEKDDLGLSRLSQFEDTINDMMLYYDLDEHDRDLELLRAMKSKFLQEYYQAKMRSTGFEALDILFSLETAFKSISTTFNAEGEMLISRVRNELDHNALYNDGFNRVVILAPYIYPHLTDKGTMNKDYALFNIIGHEIFHSVVLAKWAKENNAFKNGMDCMNEHYNRTCDSFAEGSCKSGPQTFEEDGSDIEGLRINYEFLTRNNGNEQLKEPVFESKLLSVNREQAFFYLAAIEFCGTIATVPDHFDIHSYKQVRVNGMVTQMHEFSDAFSCSPNQAMFSTKEQTCHLFGPHSQ